jgi:hypothetical protein
MSYLQSFIKLQVFSLMMHLNIWDYKEIKLMKSIQIQFQDVTLNQDMISKDECSHN